LKRTGLLKSQLPPKHGLSTPEHYTSDACSPLKEAVVNAVHSLQSVRMIELIRTNDSVLLSFAEALMKEAGIAYFIADTNMSIIEGSLGVLPRRLLVSEDQLEEARQILIDAKIEHELRDR
jgi:hypothetical protein